MGPRAVLIFNPLSGHGRERRLRVLEACAAVLRDSRTEVELVATTSPGSAGRQAAEAVHSGRDTILACGGDGTVHEVLQGLMQSERTRAARLGVVPLGTGNILAADLGLPANPVRAVQAQLDYRPRRIAVGRVDYRGAGEQRQRYFLVTAGIGLDAEVLYRATVQAKGRLGLAAYLFEGLRLALRSDYPPFRARYVGLDGRKHALTVSQAFAVRVTNFGGLMGRFAPGAALTRNDVQIVLFRSRRFVDYALYMTGVLTRQYWKAAGVELVHATELECEPLDEGNTLLTGGQKVTVEADGEALGHLPARVTVVPDAINLLMKPSG